MTSKKTPAVHHHQLSPHPAHTARRLPAPPNHPAFQEPKPIPVWKCDRPGCEFETWSVSWFRR